jgi:hypothetical protein
LYASGTPNIKLASLAQMLDDLRDFAAAREAKQAVEGHTKAVHSSCFDS